MTTDIHDLCGRPIVIGGGLAGLMTALRLAPAPVLLISKSPLGSEASSAWAQGGLAAALGDDDSAALHAADTIAAGDGLCDPDIVDEITREAPAAIEELARLGARFDRARNGAFNLGLEAAHSRRRIAHATSDGTGREVLRALIEAARRTPSITLLEGVDARRLLVDNNRIAGLLCSDSSGRSIAFSANRIILATGGIGGLFSDSTNPLGSFGQGLALAARAGAALADLEFVQFHPTALDGPTRPMRLVSEAVRGEGAILVDETGARFMAHEDRAELAPRDVVARRVWRHLNAGHRVYLDARDAIGASFPKKFPAIARFCREIGIDAATQPIPVRPAQHYHMGGVAVDRDGRSTVEGLWACGEVACTGVHGANRLASNSLMETVVFGKRVVEHLESGDGGAAAPSPVARRVHRPRGAAPSHHAVQEMMWECAGIERDGAGLRHGLDQVAGWQPIAKPNGRPDHERRQMAVLASLMLTAALDRTESRGGHYRRDFPARDDLHWKKQQVWKRDH